jgi:hypothetical protein
MTSLGRAAAAGLLAVAPGADISAAQSRRVPFETLEVAITVFTDLNHSRFHDFWDPGLGFEALVEVPFYFGAAQVGLQQFQNAARLSTVPDFRSRFFYTGWSADVWLGGKARWTGGIQAGVFHMRFDADTAPFAGRSEPSETELGLGATSMLQYRLGGRWYVAVIARYQLVLTDQRIRRLMLGAGLSRQFTTPPWLRAFLD